MATLKSQPRPAAKRRGRSRVDIEVDRALMARLRSDANRIAYRFGLLYRAIDAERANVKNRYGICYSDGSIRIRLRHNSTKRPLRYSSLVNTLCHELAHLRHFHHGPSFQEFYARVLQYARNEGIYRPESDRQRRHARDELPLVESGPPPPVPARAWHRRPTPSVAPRKPNAPTGDPQLPLFG